MVLKGLCCLPLAHTPGPPAQELKLSPTMGSMPLPGRLSSSPDSTARSLDTQFTCRRSRKPSQTLSPPPHELRGPPALSQCLELPLGCDHVSPSPDYEPLQGSRRFQPLFQPLCQHKGGTQMAPEKCKREIRIKDAEMGWGAGERP